jgi:hypothetical protein
MTLIHTYSKFKTPFNEFAWQAYSIELLRQYAECAARHAKTVQAWPK